MENNLNFNKIQFYTFFGILATVTFVFVGMIWSMLYAVFLAIILTIIFKPLYLKILKKFSNRDHLAASLVILIIVLILLVPVLSLLPIIANQALNITSSIGSAVGHYLYDDQALNQTWQKLPLFRSIDQGLITQKISQFTNSLGTFIFESIQGFIKNTFEVGLAIFVMLYATFYFLKDSEKIIQQMIRLSPLGDEYERKFYHNFIITTKAVLKSTLLLGLIQGTIGTLAFWILGVSNSLFWGLLMTMFAILPILGTGIVWVPIGIIQIFIGNTFAGIFILVFGFLVIGNIDNLLRPLMLEKKINMHPLLIFLSTLGGLAMFGIFGFIIGPIIASLFVELWNIYEYKYSRELTNN